MERNYWTLPKPATQTSFLERVCLFFRPTYVAFDGCVVFYKVMGGRVYVTGIEPYPRTTQEDS